MKSKKLIPKVVEGGAAVPLGKNFYYMTGRKHKDGGIDVGKNASTGIEVEDGELMHLTNKEVKVFSSVPFLKGQSPAQKVLGGENPTKVFNAQESFKKDNGVNDDGTVKQNKNKIMNRNKYVGGGKKKADPILTSPINGGINLYNYDDSNFNNIKTDAEQNMNNSVNLNPNLGTSNIQTGVGRVLSDIKIGAQRASEKINDYYSERPGAAGDTIGLASNIIGGIVSNKANSKMLDRLKYAPQPVARQAAKLKTTININPQLDKMRETVSAYEKDVDANTASSRVALARKQRGRLAGALETNELYGNKENIETQLINRDKLNQQAVADANVVDYNRWSEGKAAFNNAITEKRSENTIGLIETLNAGVQDVISRGEKRSANRENMLTLSAGNPNVNPRILKDLGVKSITNKMVEDWEKANVKKGKKSSIKSK